MNSALEAAMSIFLYCMREREKILDLLELICGARITYSYMRIGGVGYDGVRNFYRDHLVGKFFPPDVKMTDVSRTVDDHQIVLATYDFLPCGRSPLRQ